mgnify:CR=1 FL=1
MVNMIPEDEWTLAKETEAAERVKLARFASFDGGHGREGSIAVLDGLACDVCHATTRVLVVDASENEYAPGAICQPCTRRAFGS